MTSPTTIPPTTTSATTTGTSAEGAPVADDVRVQPTIVDVPAELEPASPPLVDEHGRVRLSFSRIDTYRRCPRQFRYAYIDRLPGRPAPALSFGTSIHGALERFYDRKLPTEPTEEELLGFLFEEWESVGFGAVDRDEQVRYYRHAQDVLRRYHRRVSGRYRLPVATEAWFELPVGDEAVVVGSIDRVDVDGEGRLRVVDYKTNRRARTRDDVRSSLQLALYALACRHLYGDLPVAVALEFVVPGVTVEATIDELDLDHATDVALQTARAVVAGRYDPEPSRLCDWCDFRAGCEAWSGDGPELLGPAQVELDALRRRVSRDVANLRALESGVARLRGELERDGDTDVSG